MICMVFFCKFVHLFPLLFCPSDCEIVNTCKMSRLRVNFLAASLPRVPGYMVLFLFFGFAMSSTMTASFLYHVVRDRECIQFLVYQTFFWIRCKPRIVRKCNTQFLDSNEEDSENIVLLEKFRTTRITLHCPIRGSLPSNCC